MQQKCITDTEHVRFSPGHLGRIHCLLSVGLPTHPLPPVHILDLLCWPAPHVTEQLPQLLHVVHTEY